MGKGRAPCCDKIGLKKGSWTPAEDMRLTAYIHKHGHGNWRALPKKAGLLRCGKSCRLRWINYLRPDIKRGNFTKKEEDTIIELHQLLGNKWSKIASHLPGRTDNEIKNVWNTHLKKRLNQKDPPPPPSPPSSGSCSSLCEGASTVGVWPSIDIPDACNLTHTNAKLQEATEDGAMEIFLVSDLQMWDVLEGQTSSFSSPTSTTNNNADVVDTRLPWNMQFDDDHLALLPPPLTDLDPKPTPCSSPTHDSGAPIPPHLLEDAKRALDSEATHNMEESAAADGVEGIGAWIEYLERELDLWSGSDHQTVLTDLIEPPKMTCCEDHHRADFDPITSYFQDSPPY